MADVEQAQHDGQPKLRRFSYCFALLRVLSELTSLTAKLQQGGVGVGELGERERGKEGHRGCSPCHARCAWISRVCPAGGYPDLYNLHPLTSEHTLTRCLRVLFDWNQAGLPICRPAPGAAHSLPRQMARRASNAVHEVLRQDWARLGRMQKVCCACGMRQALPAALPRAGAAPAVALAVIHCGPLPGEPRAHPPPHPIP